MLIVTVGNQQARGYPIIVIFWIGALLILLQISQSVAIRVGGGIVRIKWIKAVSRLPFIRHAIAVRVGQ